MCTCTLFDGSQTRIFHAQEKVLLKKSHKFSFYLIFFFHLNFPIATQIDTLDYCDIKFAVHRMTCK
jgi:hypothetical protein